MRLRPAIDADADAISALITSYSPFAPGTPGREPFFESISRAAMRERLAQPGYRFVVALQDDELVGVIALRGGRQVAFFFVREDSHGKGVGRRLWDAMLALAREAGHAGPYGVNADLLAVPFYERLGFVVSGEQTQSLGVPCIPMTCLAAAR